ncbi:MAG: hypothetical protein ACI814_002750 [Mariniblastus sp.]|jgi:hypothetical protein
MDSSPLQSSLFFDANRKSDENRSVISHLRSALCDGYLFVSPTDLARRDKRETGSRRDLLRWNGFAAANSCGDLGESKPNAKIGIKPSWQVDASVATADGDGNGKTTIETPKSGGHLHLPLPPIHTVKNLKICFPVKF